jgi:hypothetical protein
MQTLELSSNHDAESSDVRQQFPLPLAQLIVNGFHTLAGDVAALATRAGCCNRRRQLI